MISDSPELTAIQASLGGNPAVEFAVLVGSRAEGRSQPQSDWDIALWLAPSMQGLQRHGMLVDIQLQVARALGVSPEQVDIIDLQCAGLAMREQVVNAGVVLAGGNKLSWAQFQTRTWREIEDFQWSKHVYGY